MLSLLMVAWSDCDAAGAIPPWLQGWPVETANSYLMIQAAAGVVLVLWGNA